MNLLRNWCDLNELGELALREEEVETAHICYIYNNCTVTCNEQLLYNYFWAAKGKFHDALKVNP